MGTDMWTMIEVSKDGEPWRVLRGFERAQKTRRDYVLFSLLADVANNNAHHTPTWNEPKKVIVEGEEHEIPGWWYDPDNGGHEKIEPLAMPRGVPDDATDEWQATALMWKVKSSTVDTTWLTPEEILSANWDQTVTFYGMVSEDEYAALKKDNIFPENHIGQVGGPHVTVVTEEEYEAGKRGEKLTYIRASWQAGTVRDLSGYMLEAMKEITAGVPSSYKVRLMLLFEA